MKIEASLEQDVRDLANALTARPSAIVQRALTGALLAIIESVAVVQTRDGRRIGVAEERNEPLPLPVSDTNGSHPDDVQAYLYREPHTPNGFD